MTVTFFDHRFHRDLDGGGHRFPLGMNWRYGILEHHSPNWLGRYSEVGSETCFCSFPRRSKILSGDCLRGEGGKIKRRTAFMRKLERNLNFIL